MQNQGDDRGGNNFDPEAGVKSNSYKLIEVLVIILVLIALVVLVFI